MLQPRDLSVADANICSRRSPEATATSVMHSPDKVQAALRLQQEGANACEIARELGIPRTTVRDWLRGQVPWNVVAGGPTAFACDRCGHAAHRYDELPEAYVYLLGLYLGDGSISQHARGVYRLRITLDNRYPGIIESAARALREVRGGSSHVQPRRTQDCSDVSAYWRSWPCLIPQHGPGRKHDRPIVLADWQSHLARRWPEQLLRGLIHSDGCRFQNTGRNWSWPRYSFTQFSDDIRRIFCDTCDLIGVRWTASGKHTVYVSRKADVAILDEFIGPKR